MNVIKPSIPMRSKPDQTSSLETECLFGETVSILDNYQDWYYCKLLTDNYYGWVQKRFLGEIIVSSHRVVSNRSNLLKKTIKIRLYKLLTFRFTNLYKQF